ncbi:MAG: cytochrome c biogenesis protein CcsA [Holophaga sp.]|nr:cytochrome c biogenesis protein CcsA [Holophaga sp.]
MDSMMEDMWGQTSLSAITLILYAAAEGFSISHLRTNKDSHGKTTSWLLLVGFLIHWFALYAGARAAHAVPYHDLPASMSFFSWVVIGSYGILLLKHREGSTGPFLIPIALLFLLISLFTQGGVQVLVKNPKLSGPLFAFHVTMALVGYAALTLSFVLAQLYLIQNAQLRRRKLGLLFSRLPALDVLSQLHRTSVTIGVSALSVAAVLGLIWAKINWGTYWDPKVLFTFLIIVVYLFTLFPRWIGWGGKKIAILSMTGFLFVLFSYTIVNLFISRGHTFR